MAVASLWPQRLSLATSISLSVRTLYFEQAGIIAAVVCSLIVLLKGIIGVGILRRVFDAVLKAMEESRQKQIEREIANYVALRGGRMTDDLEREITRRLFTSDWSPRERQQVSSRCICSLVMTRI
jgi:hypothetical protein